jgi:hypothetical protein
MRRIFGHKSLAPSRSGFAALLFIGVSSQLNEKTPEALGAVPLHAGVILTSSLPPLLRRAR